MKRDLCRRCGHRWYPKPTLRKGTRGLHCPKCGHLINPPAWGNPHTSPPVGYNRRDADTWERVAIFEYSNGRTITETLIRSSTGRLLHVFAS